MKVSFASAMEHWLVSVSLVFESYRIEGERESIEGGQERDLGRVNKTSFP